MKSVQIIRQTRYDLAKYLTRIKGIGISPIEITMTDHIYVSRFEPIKRSIKILKFRVVVYLCEVIRYLVQPAARRAPHSITTPPSRAMYTGTPLASPKELEEAAEMAPPPIAKTTYTT